MLRARSVSFAPNVTSHPNPEDKQELPPPSQWGSRRGARTHVVDSPLTEIPSPSPAKTVANPASKSARGRRVQQRASAVPANGAPSQRDLPNPPPNANIVPETPETSVDQDGGSQFRYDSTAGYGQPEYPVQHFGDTPPRRTDISFDDHDEGSENEDKDKDSSDEENEGEILVHFYVFRSPL